mgnify:FL=1
MKEANLGIEGDVKLILRYHEYQKQINPTQELDLIRIDETRRYVVYECSYCGFSALWKRWINE